MESQLFGGAIDAVNPVRITISTTPAMRHLEKTGILIKNNRIPSLVFDTSCCDVKQKTITNKAVAPPQNNNKQHKVSDLITPSISVIPVSNTPQQMDAERNELRQQRPFLLNTKAINSQDKTGNKINIILDTNMF